VTITSFDPALPGFVDDPYPTYDRLRAEDPVHWSERLRSWMVFRYDDADRVFRDPLFSADRMAAKKFKGARSGVRSISSDPPEHTLVRGAITSTLTNSVIEAMRPRVERLVGDLVARVGDRGEFDLIADFAYPLPITVIAELFAVPEEDRAKFEAWSAAMARSMDHFYAAKGGSGLSDIAAYVAQLATARQKEPGDDLISALLQHDELTFSELVGLGATLIFAGHETTTNLIGNGMLGLLRDPDQMAAMRASIGDTSAVRVAVEEMLRFDTPAQMLTRVIADDAELGGKQLRAGDSILTVVGAGNRDPSVFAEADHLRIDRQPNPHLGFGAGLHYCVGAALSRREALVAFPALLDRFPNLRLAGPPRWRDTIVLRGLESLPVAVG
jgi:cytochrome P450